MKCVTVKSIFKIWFPVIFILLTSMNLGLNAQEVQHPKIALVLSGGGAKGFAHIGALKVIEQSGIPIDIIVGNSIGSIVGGLYSIGYTASEIESFANSTDWEQLFADEVPRKLMAQDLQINQQRYVLSLPVDENNIPRLPFSLIKGQNVLNLLCELTSNAPINADFSKFPVDFACIGVDITNGEEVVIRNGFLPTAIYSSISIPGVFQLEEHNGRTMVDGGVVNNFPTDVAKSMGADIIIGVDIRNDLQTKAELQTMRDLVNQLINFYSIDKDSINKEYCDVLIRPDISGFSGSSYNAEAVDSLISRGFKAATKALPEIERINQEFNLKPRNINRSMAEKQSYYINKIELSGNYSLTDNFISSQIDMELPGKYSTDEIKAVIDRIYGLGCFSKVYFKIREDEEGGILELILNESAIKDFNLGLRVNTTNAVGILLNYTQKDYKRWVGSYSLSAEVSSNPGFDIKAEITRENLPAIGINLKGKYKTYDYFEGRNKRASAQLYFGAANIYLFHHYGTYSRAGIGFTEEFFTGDIFSEEPDSLIISAGDNAFISNLYTFYSRDNLDHYYYPTKGSEIYAEFALFEDERFDNINPSVLVNLRSFIPLANHFTLLLNTHVRSLMSAGYPVLKSNFYGGHDYEIYFDNHLPFYGAPPIGVSRSYTAIGLTGIRMQFGRHYVSVMGNVLAHNNDIQALEDTGFIWGTGLTYSFRSLGGPLEITMSYSGAVKRLGFSVNLGLWY